MPRWSGFRLFSGFGAQCGGFCGTLVSRRGSRCVRCLVVTPSGVAPAVGWSPGGVSPAGVWDIVMLGGCVGLLGVCPASWSGACRCAGCVSVAFLGSCGWAVFPLVGGSGDGVCPAIFRLAGWLAVIVFRRFCAVCSFGGDFRFFRLCRGCGAGSARWTKVV